MHVELVANQSCMGLGVDAWGSAQCCSWFGVGDRGELTPGGDALGLAVLDVCAHTCLVCGCTSQQRTRPYMDTGVHALDRGSPPTPSFPPAVEECKLI